MSDETRTAPPRTEDPRTEDPVAEAPVDEAPVAEALNVLRCPRDQRMLVETEYETGISVDECPVCHGRWLDSGELELIQETVERDYRKDMDERPEWSSLAYDVSREMSEERLACPDCGGEMSRMEYARVSQVVVDVCPECRGVWLDAGELERLEIFFERIQAEAPLDIPWWARLSLLFHGRRKKGKKK